MGITARTVVRLVLCFSLLVAFTTSASAALCLQMEHTPGAMTGSAVAMVPPDRASGAGAVSVSSGSKGSPSAHACCYQQSGTPDAVVPPQRAVPDASTDGLPAAVVQLPAKSGYLPPGLLSPALEKRDHLTPSLTVLSISRT